LYKEAGARQQVVVRIPEKLFMYRGCLDALDCFWYSAKVDAPAVMLANPRKYSKRALPPADAVDRKQRLEADYPALLRETCAAATNQPTASWLAAAGPPKLCNGSIEHGIFTRRLLKTALLQSCGAHCVFTLGRQPQAPATSIGWSLDMAHKCWRETGSDDQCMLWLPSRARTLPPAVDCPAAPPRLEQSPKCALGMPPGKELTGGACGPSLLIAGVRGCAVDTLSDLLAQTVKPQRGVMAPSFAARRAFYGASTMTDVVATTFAEQFEGTMSFDDTLAFFDHTPELPFAVKHLLPDAKVIFLVCEPLKRLQSDLEAALHSADERRSDAKLLRSLDINSFEQLERRVMAPCLTADDDFAACRQMRRAFLERSVYATAVADWQSAFGADVVTAVDGSTLKSEPQAVLQRVFHFAGWTPPPGGFSVITRDAPDEPRPRPAGTELATLLAGSNAWLADLLSAEFPLHWTVDESAPPTARPGAAGVLDLGDRDR
jgi:hypothetical protein